MSDQQVTTPSDGLPVPPGLLEALARGVAAALTQPQPAPSSTGEAADFLTAGQLGRRLGISRETVRRLAIAGDLPCTVMCQGKRKTTRRYPRRFADDFVASGKDVADLAKYAARWRAQVAAGSRAPETGER